MISRSADDELVPLYRFWQPKYWGLWVAVVLLRLITLLPFRWQMRLGGALGRWSMPFVPKRRDVARINLRLCFPDLDDARIDELVREHFESTGMSMIEMGLAWFISDRRARKLVNIITPENALDEIAKGEPVILLSGHFPGGEIVGIAARQLVDEMGAMYRPTNKPVRRPDRPPRTPACGHAPDPEGRAAPDAASAEEGRTGLVCVGPGL